MTFLTLKLTLIELMCITSDYDMSTNYSERSVFRKTMLRPILKFLIFTKF